MADLGTYKQHGAGILTSSHTGTATDARCGIHGHIGFMFWNRNRVGIRHTARGGADVSSSLDDLVECGTVYHKVTDDRERLGTPGLNPNVIAIMELAHVQLTGGDAVIVTMRATVDIESAHAADALATVVVEAHGMGYAVVDELLVQDVEHLKERAVGRDAFQRIGFEMALWAMWSLMSCSFKMSSISRKEQSGEMPSKG